MAQEALKVFSVAADGASPGKIWWLFTPFVSTCSAQGKGGCPHVGSRRHLSSRSPVPVSLDLSLTWISLMCTQVPECLHSGSLFLASEGVPKLNGSA